MEHKLKMISKEGIEEALSKATLYRYLNEPEETESICHDILAVEPGHQLALRMLGLAITDQFTGQGWDRHVEVEEIFQRLSDAYERHYYMGLLYERRAKAQMRTGRPANGFLGLFHEAMRHFEEAERIRPPQNDDAMLRWNRCVRLLQNFPAVEGAEQEVTLDDHDLAPAQVMRSNARGPR